MHKKENCSAEVKKNRKFYSLLAGGILSAFLAGSCCLAPLLFLLFGVSVGSLSFLQWFAPYHLYFTIAAVAVMLYLWVEWFRSRKSRLSCGTTLCKHYLLYLWTGTLFVTVLTTYPWWMNYLFD